MEIFTLLETLEDIVESARSMPFTESVLVNKNDILDLVKEIRLKLPDELKQAKWIKEERERIMAEAHKDADDIVKEAENRIISMIDEHEITRKAYDKKEEIVAEANENYRIMAKESKEYADELLAGVENTVKLLEDTLLNVEATIKQTVEIWKIVSIAAIQAKNITYWTSFESTYSLSSLATETAIASIPIGIKYFIKPIIPPSIGLNTSPIAPFSPYIKTNNNTLIISSDITAKSKLNLLFLLLL